MPRWMVHLRSARSGPLVASFSTAPLPQKQRQRQSRPLKLIQGSMSARKVERQSPWLAGLHRVATGALVGLGLSMLGLSALSVYWQNEWAHSFAKLEAAKMLEHRTQESSAVLEKHHLGAVRRPGHLVPTSSERLIHLTQPKIAATSTSTPLLSLIRLGQIPAGY